MYAETYRGSTRIGSENTQKHVKIFWAASPADKRKAITKVAVQAVPDILVAARVSPRELQRCL